MIPKVKAADVEVFYVSGGLVVFMPSVIVAQFSTRLEQTDDGE